MATKATREATLRYRHLSPVGVDWNTYLDLLHRADAVWRDVRRDGHAVLGDGCSWERAIRAGHAVVRLPDWERLQPLEADVLIGSGQRDQAFMFLGNNFGAGSANHMFRGEDTRTQRRQVHDVLKALPDVPVSELPMAAEAAYRSLLDMERIGPGVATRLIALARPDCATSVNSASRWRLGTMSGIAATTLGRPERYRALLEWIAAQPWHRSPRPPEPREREIWEMRAALLDCFAYDPKVPDPEHAAPPSDRGIGIPPGARSMPRSVADHLPKLHELCRRYHVARLALFGSAANERFDPARSDLDFVVEYLPVREAKPLGAYTEFREALERLFGRPVDLVERAAVRNPYFRQELEETQVQLYAA